MTRKAPASRRPAGSIRARVLICRHGKSNPGIWAAANQPDDGQISKSLSSPSGKNSSLLLSGKSALGLPPSCPTRGAIARRTSAGRDAVDAAASGERMRAGRMMLMRTAKSCGSDAPMLASSLANFRGTTVSKKPGHRGEREVSRKTIARGMPGDFRCTCGDYARVLHLISHARLRAHRAPGIPCALCLSRDIVLQSSGASRRGNAYAYLDLTSLRGAKRRSNPFLLRGNMDCFAYARNDGLGKSNQ